MGIISRFKDIMSANINALLDKAEDPEKMIDQYLRNLEGDLAKVKQETASVMAEEAKAKRQLDECTAEVAKMQSYAEKAVLAGNDEDAKRFLMKKKELVVKQTSLQETYTLAAENAAKMRQMHQKLVGDISQLNSRRDAIKAKIAVAKTQQTIRLEPVWMGLRRAFPHLTRWRLRLIRCLMRLMPWQSLTEAVSIQSMISHVSMRACQHLRLMTSSQHLRLRWDRIN